MHPHAGLSGWRKWLRRPWYWWWQTLERLAFAGRRYPVVIPWGYRVLSPWFAPAEDPLFAAAYAAAQAGGDVNVSADRCYLLHRFCREALLRQGDIAECGVYQGGTAHVLAETIRQEGDLDRHLHLFDTFSGMPAETRPDRDYHSPGDFGDTSLEEVQGRLNAYAFTQFHPGRVPLTFSEPDETDRFTFVHLDMDIYEATLEACKWFWPRMVTGGVVIFDDYGMYAYRYSVRAAVDHWFADQPESPITLPTGQGLAIKH